MNNPPQVQNNGPANIAPHQPQDPTFNISELDLSSAFHSMKVKQIAEQYNLHMAQRKPSPKKAEKDYMSDDDTSDEETDL